MAIEVAGLSKAYDETLFDGVDAFFARGDRVAIVGPNGAGKTTFLRIISGEMPPDRGGVRYGTGLTTAAYSQSSVDDLASGDTAAEAVMRMGVTDEEARGLLGRLNLGGNSGDKPVEAFSGGERRRIMLARLMAQRADCLFLDEPTNDLDIPSREALEEVLASYDGALFVVSHDRYLLKRLAERVVSIRDGAATVIDGDYETYERLEHAARKSAAPAKAAAKSEPSKGNRKAAHQTKLDLGRRKRAVTEAEQRVADLEAERSQIERRFAATDVYDDPDTVVLLQRELDRIRGESDKAMSLWERAVQALES